MGTKPDAQGRNHDSESFGIPDPLFSSRNIDSPHRPGPQKCDVECVP